jgi:hypothetical protein
MTFNFSGGSNSVEDRHFNHLPGSPVHGKGKFMVFDDIQDFSHAADYSPKSLYTS